jgi:hypothetical protein
MSAPRKRLLYIATALLAVIICIGVVRGDGVRLSAKSKSGLSAAVVLMPPKPTPKMATTGDTTVTYGNDSPAVGTNTGSITYNIKDNRHE